CGHPFRTTAGAAVRGSPSGPLRPPSVAQTTATTDTRREPPYPDDCKQRLRHESATASAAAAAQALRRFPATDKSPHRSGLRLQAYSVFEPCGPRSCFTSLRLRRFFG
ncbi:unnamed protein product, partial [Ixodes pacificus]